MSNVSMQTNNDDFEDPFVKTKLRSCKKCGGKGKMVLNNIVTFSHIGSYCVKCDKCGYESKSAKIELRVFSIGFHKPCARAKAAKFWNEEL